jgi:hypothetical protein
MRLANINLVAAILVLITGRVFLDFSEFLALTIVCIIGLFIRGFNKHGG